MCGAVVKHLATLTKLCGSFKAQLVTLAFSVTPPPSPSLCFFLFIALASHAFKLLYAFALFRLSNAINFEPNCIFVCATSSCSCRAATKYLNSYLENSIYFLAIAIAFCCKFSLVVWLLAKANAIAAANNLQYVA